MGFIFAELFHKISQIFNIFLAAMIAFCNTLGIQVSMRGCYDSIYSLISYSFYEPTVKISSSGLMDKKAEHEIYLAKNEREACQVAFRLRVARDVMKVEMSEFTNENGDVLESELYYEYYVNGAVENPMNSIYPEAIVPVQSSKTFHFRAEAAYPFYINVRSYKDTPAGDYTATIKVYNAEDPESERDRLELEVTAHVWNFTLPETPSSETAFGLNKTYIAAAHGVSASSKEAQELYEKYYEFLVDRKISPYNLPVDILSDEADKYMSDPRVTSFTIPYYSDDAILAKAYAKVQSNPEWAKKGYFYPIDEPHTQAQFDSYNAIIERLERICPGYNMVTPFYSLEVPEDATINPFELQKNYNTIICPETICHVDKGFREDMKTLTANGKRSWWYVCCAPTGNYCNLFVYQEGIRHRILFWQQKDYDVGGMLYWDTTYWRYVNYDPWSSSFTVPWTGDEALGDGSLMYNGNYVGIDGPVSSLRLEAVANGLEDYDYLTMAEELLGEKYVDKMIDNITADLTHYTYSDKTFAKTRILLGEAIEEAVNK